MPGTSAIGFGGGFLQGLSGAIERKRQRDDLMRQQQIRNVFGMMQTAIDSGQVEGGIQGLQPAIDQLVDLGALPKPGKGKPGQPDIHAVLQNVLGQTISKPLPGVGPTGAGQPAGAPQAAGAAAPAAGGEEAATAEGALPGAPAATPPLPSTPISAPAPTSAAPSQTFFGMPIISPEQAAQRNLTRQMGTLEAETNTKIDLARRLYPKLKAADPSMTMEDALRVVGVKEPTARPMMPRTMGRDIAASDLPADAIDQSGQPIDKSQAKFWRPMMGTQGIFYTPGAAPTSAAGRVSVEQDYYKQYAKEHGFVDAQGEGDPSQMPTSERDKATNAFHSPRWASTATEANKTSRAHDVAEGIANGEIPADPRGTYGLWSYIEKDLAKNHAGFDLSKQMLDWQATQAFTRTANNSTQTRLRNATEFVDQTVAEGGLIDQLSKQLASHPVLRTKFPKWNSAALAYARNGGPGIDRETQRAAQNLENEIGLLQTEVATMIQSGNSPTNESFERASKLIQGNWDADMFDDALKLMRENVQIRRNSMKLSPVTVSPPGAPGGGAAAPQGGGGSTGANATMPGVTIGPDGTVSVGGQTIYAPR